MSILIGNPIHAQIAVYYSDERKYEMAMHGEKNCDALFTLIQDVLNSHGAEIEKVIIPSGHDKPVDFLLDVKIENAEKLDEVKNALASIVGAGTKKITVFTK